MKSFFKKKVYLYTFFAKDSFRKIDFFNFHAIILKKHSFLQKPKT